MTEPISPSAFHQAGGTEDWRVLGEGACAYFRTGSFAAGARLVQAIGELAGVDDHHPDVDVRGDGVTVRLVTVTPDHVGMSTRRERTTPASPGSWCGYRPPIPRSSLSQASTVAATVSSADRSTDL